MVRAKKPKREFPCESGQECEHWAFPAMCIVHWDAYPGDWTHKVIRGKACPKDRPATRPEEAEKT